MISLPIEYSVEASIGEQLGLSRFADEKSNDSLLAALNELLVLMKSMKKISEAKTNKIAGRKIHQALAKTYLRNSSIEVLDDAEHNISNFMESLNEVGEFLKQATLLLSEEINNP